MSDSETEKILQKYRLPIFFFLFGLILLGAGILKIKRDLLLIGQTKPMVIPGQLPQNEIQKKILVEAAGAVKNPGIYELEIGSRTQDLLASTGGLLKNSDQIWLSKYINLVRRLSDGEKIYFPFQDEVISNLSEESKEKEEARINLNTATQKELEGLWGIGPVTAQKIISGRPYQSPDELLKRKLVKTNVWERIKDQIKVY